jgi:Ca2+-binding RTX toxin-like protein
MKRLHILLTVVVVMFGVFFAAHEAIAKVLTGTAGDDALIGTDLDDCLRGRAGNDYLKGYSGNDYLSGGVGDDILDAGIGDDEIKPGEGSDVFYAGPGNDRIYARDTESLDDINCGTGFDQVETIHRDDRTMRNCERALGPKRGNI